MKNTFLWTLIQLLKYFAKKHSVCLETAHWTHKNFFLANYFNIFHQSTWKIYFVSFPNFLNKILLVMSKSTVRHFNICVTRKIFLVKIQKHGFPTWKTTKSQTKKIMKYHPKKIDHICFILFFLFLFIFIFKIHCCTQLLHSVKLAGFLALPPR